MNKILSSVALFTVCGFATAQNTITVKLSDVRNDTAVFMLMQKDLRRIERKDTVIAKKHVFTYRYTGDKTRVAIADFQTASGKRRKEFYLVPGEQGKLSGTSENSIWSGSQFYTDLAALKSQTSPIEKQYSDVVTDFQMKIQAGQNRDSIQQVAQKVCSQLRDSLDNVTLDFIRKNPKSGVSAMNLASVKDSEKALSLLDASLKSQDSKYSDFVQLVETRVARNKELAEAQKKVAAGCKAPDFTLTDINGKPLELSSLRGRYLVLDFWGSWCGWCIKGMPEMKKYYEKYAGRFEILGIACNDTEAKWKAAVENNQLPWKHVINGKRGTADDVTARFAISGFPTKIVLDPEGNILKTVVGEDPEFYTYLDELLGTK